MSNMQLEYWANSTHRWNVKEGATRSGKTFMDYYLIAKRIRATHNKPGIRVLIGNTQSTLERNILDPMRDIWGTKLVGTIKNNNTLNLFGEKVYAVGADKASQVAKIQGSGMSYCYGDEITTWSPKVFDMLKSRLSYSYSTFDGTCNPDSPTHWFKEFLDGDSDIYRQSYTLFDNPFLDKRVIKDIETDYKGTIYYNRFVLGEWALAEGLIYQCFDTYKDPIEKIEEPLSGRAIVSCDYGTSNPCVFLMFEEGLSGKWYLTKEYYYSGRESKLQKTDEQYVSEMLKFIKGKTIEAIIVDPSAASFITALSQKNLVVWKADNNVADGIRRTMSQLNNKNILILKSCIHTIKELGSYVWDSKPDRNGKEVPVKENDHCCDALRYFVNYFKILQYDPFN